MRYVTLPKTATIAGRTVRLRWEMLDSMDGWYAKISPRVVRELERDPSVSMDAVEQDLREYGDYTRYGEERNINRRYLCVYKRA